MKAFRAVASAASEDASDTVRRTSDSCGSKLNGLEFSFAEAGEDIALLSLAGDLMSSGAFV